MSRLRLSSIAVLLVCACDGPTAEPTSAASDASVEQAPTPAEPASPPKPVADPAATMGGKTCEGIQGMPNLVAGMRPSTPAHYVELRKIVPGDDGPAAEKVSSMGTPCEGATDGAACQAALAAALPTSGFGFGCRPLSCHEVLVATRGDEVVVVDALEKLPAFLGPVDTLGEALLILRAHEYQAGTCEDVISGKLEQTGEGFVAKVAKRIADCPVQHADYELLVTPAGEVVVRSEKKRPLGKQKMCI